MAGHDRKNYEKTEEAEKGSQHRKKDELLYDQLKAADEGTVDFLGAPSVDRHAALLAGALSDSQRANLVIRLQQSYGNAYVQRLLNSRAVQAKLTINPPGDEYEREADRVAHLVTQAPAAGIQHQAEDKESKKKAKEEAKEKAEEAKEKAKGEIKEAKEKAKEEVKEAKEKAKGEAKEAKEEEELQMKPVSEVQRQEEEELQMKPAAEVQRQAEEEEEEEMLQMKPVSEVQRQPEEEELQMKPAAEVQRQEEEELQMKPAAEVQRQPEEEELQMKPAADDVETRINAARGSGEPLPESTRASLELQFGRDFSDVRIHTDAEADKLSEQLRAEAFTTGQDIFFRQGNYRPDTGDGKELIAHELTHVVQQQAAPAIQRQPKAKDEA